MGQSTKALVQLVLIICIFGSLQTWIFSSNTRDIWGWRIGFAIGLAATDLLWYRASNRKENLPDLLAQVTRAYFERDGLCFAPTILVENGICWVSIYFQNRYANPCSCSVQFLPPPRSFWFGRHNLPNITALINCPGGAFGVTRIPYAVPEKYQRRSLRFDVYASNHFPQGKGQLLRFREGIRTGSNAPFTISNSRAVSTIFFPSGLASSVSPLLQPTFEILWQPDLPTNAFPVIPITSAIPPQRDIGFPVNPDQ